MALGVSQIGFRDDASNLNGGSFFDGGSGTDRSNDASPILTVADGVTNGTTTLSSVTGGFSANDIVDNTAYLSTGTGEYIRVISITTDNAVIMDRIIAADTAITVNVGGAWASPTNALAALFPLGKNKINVKTGTYNLTADFNGQWGGTVTIGLAVMEGYKDTPGDGLAVGTDAPLFALGVYKWTTDSNMITRDIRVTTSNTFAFAVNGSGGIENVRVDSTSTAGPQTCRPAVGTFVKGCEFTAPNATAASYGILAIGEDVSIDSCYIHDMGTSGTGARLSRYTYIMNTILDGLAVGVECAAHDTVIEHDTFYDNDVAVTLAGNRARSIAKNIFNSNVIALNTATYTQPLTDNEFSGNGTDIVSTTKIEKSTGATADVTGFVSVITGNFTPEGLAQEVKFFSYTLRGAVQIEGGNGAGESSYGWV